MLQAKLLKVRENVSSLRDGQKQKVDSFQTQMDQLKVGEWCQLVRPLVHFKMRFFSGCVVGHHQLALRFEGKGGQPEHAAGAGACMFFLCLTQSNGRVV